MLLTSRRKFALGVLATFALLLPPGGHLAWAQQPATAFPLTITDDAGITSTFAASPQRIVSLNRASLEVNFALGAGAQSPRGGRFVLRLSTRGQGRPAAAHPPIRACLPKRSSD